MVRSATDVLRPLVLRVRGRLLPGGLLRGGLKPGRNRRAARVSAPLRALARILLVGTILLAAPGAVWAKHPKAPPRPKPAMGCWPSAPGTDPRLCPPNDPRYGDPWEYLSCIPETVDAAKMHPRERELGAIGISLDSAWQHTTGRDDVVIAVLDSGIRWGFNDLTHKLYLNKGELPLPEGASAYDKNGDGIFNVEDYAGDSRVTDRNANGMLDPEDLILAFSDCQDNDGDGYVDDISGYDFFGNSPQCGMEAGDSDPGDDTNFGHGTGIAANAAAETNNRIEGAGVCPKCRVLPVRVGDSFVVDGNQFARGVVFAVEAGATVIAAALGSYNNTPAARAAIDYAYARGVPLITSAADEFAYHHNYPAVNNHTVYVNSIRFNHSSDYTKASTFWGVNPCTNFGARVSVTVPATTCSSGSTARLGGVAGLIESAARDAGVNDLQPEELYQMLRMTADDLDNGMPDWGSLRYPAKPGFDQFYGYGRVNALKAVTAAAQRRIPPSADLTSPDWFVVISPETTPTLSISGSIRIPRAHEAAYRMEYALGVEPRESDYKLIEQGQITGNKEGALGTLDFRKLPLPSGPAPKNRRERDRYSVTIRLHVVDDQGLTAEARRSFFVFRDPTWKGGAPLQLGASGEAAPVLADLDGDGREEIVLPTADGYLRIFKWESGGLKALLAPLDRMPALDPSTRIQDTARPDLEVRESVIRSAAVGDLNGDGRQKVVVASREGKVYVFDANGARVAPFPVSLQRERARPATPDRVVESGILSRPVLADLDGKPGLEIIVAALDGSVYAWHANGRLVDGFPVSLETPSEGAGRAAKIISTPAVGDIDGDGVPEIVVGSNTIRDGLGAVYAIRADGLAHPGGAFVPGWRPFEIAALRPELLPTIATGIPMDPILTDVDGDGDQEVVLYAVTANTILLVDQTKAGAPRILARYGMDPGRESGILGTSFLTGAGSPLLADTDGDGEAELYAPLLPFRMLTMRLKPAVPIEVPLGVGGWKLRERAGAGGRTPMLPDYPRPIEDLALLASPIAADVDGDGVKEILMGSGGYLLHAFKAGGGEADGFPKFTGGWIFSEPAVGDLDGDKLPELVTVTREGYLFVWDLARSAGGDQAARRAPVRSAPGRSRDSRRPR